MGSKCREYFIFARNYLFSCRHLPQFRLKRINNKNKFYFIFDKNYSHHPGLTDRLKAIISCYYIAKQNGYTFQIIDETESGIGTLISFRDKRMLTTKKDLEYSFWGTRFFIYSGILMNNNTKLRSNKQYHCYAYQGNDLFYHNGMEFKNRFRKLFFELFSISPEIINLIEETGLVHNKYTAIHARFVNLLGQFESSRYVSLTNEKQKVLLNKCNIAVENICKNEKNTIVVFSDSNIFLHNIKKLPVVVLDTNNIAHLSFANNKESLIKTYLDFFLLSRAEKIYRITGNGLYPTAFSLYASFLGDIKVIDYDIK